MVGSNLTDVQLQQVLIFLTEGTDSCSVAVTISNGNKDARRMLIVSLACTVLDCGQDDDTG